MVKGISRQVIVVQSPEKDLFEQAIFILTDAAVEKGVTDQQLMQQAKQSMRTARIRTPRNSLYGPLWAASGAAITGLVWLITSFL